MTPHAMIQNWGETPPPTTFWQRLFAILSAKYGFWIFITSLLCLHFLLRSLGSDSLGRDALEEAIFSQQWDWGYNPRQPPLYTWLLILFKSVFGAGIWAYQALKLVLMMISLGSLYLAACAVIPNRAYAAMAALVPSLTLVFGFEAFQFYTHSLVFTACAALTLLCLIRFTASPDFKTALALGIVIGLGLLSKYSYPLVIVGIFVSLMSVPALRHRLVSGWLLLTLALGIFLTIPHLLWLMDHPGQLSHAISYTLTDKAEITYFEAIGKALGKFLGSTFNFIAIPMILILCCFAAPLKIPFIPRRSVTDWVVQATQNTAITEDQQNFSKAWQQALYRFVLLNIVIAVSMILFFGVTRIQSHHLIGPCLWLSIPLFQSFYQKRQENGGSPLSFSFTIFLFHVLFLIAILVMLITDVDGRQCRRCYLQRPTTDISLALQANGFSQGTILTYHQLLAGGMARSFPDSQVYTQIYGHYRPQNKRLTQNLPAGQCLLIWEGKNQGMYASLRKWAQDLLSADLPAQPPIKTLSLPYYYSDSARRFSVSYALLPASGNCR